MRMHQAQKIAAKKDRQRTVDRCPRLRRTRRIVEQSQLAEEIAPFENGDRMVALPRMADQHFAGENEIDGLPLLPLVEDHFVLQVSSFMQEPIDNLHFTGIQVAVGATRQ